MSRIRQSPTSPGQTADRPAQRTARLLLECRDPVPHPPWTSPTVFFADGDIATTLNRVEVMPVARAYTDLQELPGFF
jgi:hypothetical protein